MRGLCEDSVVVSTGMMPDGPGGGAATVLPVCAPDAADERL